MSDQLVTLDVDRHTHVARLTLRRPDDGNLLTSAMARTIVEHLDEVDADDEVKVLVLEGEGQHLSRGWDPEDAWQQYVSAPGGSVRKHPSQRARLIALDESWWGPRGVYARLLHCRKVTITRAHGECLETGLYLSLCSDLVVADQNARFGCPRWRNVGVDGDISLLIGTVGLKRAKELMYCAAVWDAATALDYGLVDVVTDDPASHVANLAAMCASIMRDGIVTEKYAVFASLEKMGVGHAFATATVVGASMSNLHFQPGEYNFLKDVRDAGPDAALTHSRGASTEPTGSADV